MTSPDCLVLFLHVLCLLCLHQPSKSTGPVCTTLFALPIVVSHFIKNALMPSKSFTTHVDPEISALT